MTQLQQLVGISLLDVDIGGDLGKEANERVGIDVAGALAVELVELAADPDLTLLASLIVGWVANTMPWGLIILILIRIQLILIFRN